MCLQPEIKRQGSITGGEILRASLIAEVERGMKLICEIDDLNFRRRSQGSGSVGDQFRHSLDFINALVAGTRIGRLDYEKRERDLRVAADRSYALQRFRIAVDELSGLPRTVIRANISVRSEVDRNAWHVSSVSREMEFVLSHTIHHHALIAEIMAGFGMEAPAGFGVSPSTLAYWQRKAA
jgi:hypothetical protein